MARTLLVASDGALFGLDVMDVREVLSSPVLHPVPLGPPAVAGAINLHDSVVPVVDLAYFRGGRQMPADRIVVLQEPCMGLAVSGVHGLTERLVTMPGAIALCWVKEMFVCDRGLAGLIDPVALHRILSEQSQPGRCAGGDGLTDRDAL